MHARVTILVLILACLHYVTSFDSMHILFVIVSQSEPYHADAATMLKQEIEKQVLQLEGRSPTVYVTHKDFPIQGAWTIVPLLRPLLTKLPSHGVRWVVFLEPHTVVRYEKLVKALAVADNTPDISWIGYALRDDQSTVLHHFVTFEELDEEGGLAYPNFASGFAMRRKLMDTLMKQIESGAKRLEPFSLDASFELAKLIYGDKNNPGPQLSDDLVFCIVATDNCATYPKPFDACGRPISEKSIFFAVKTWSENHNTRVKVLIRTWGQHVTNLRFYSNKDDPSIRTVNTGVPNTRNGHCVKTMTILQMATEAVKKMPRVKWIFLADDDTILGVQRLTEVLSCYTGGDIYTVIGERYGFRYDDKQNPTEGYDFITLGGGMAMSVSAAAVLSECTCGSIDAADDMALGRCVQELNLSVTHSPLFHQNRPQDYPREVLAQDRPVSFHRHSSPEPMKVYATWFQHDDLAVRRRKRDEL